MTGKSGRGTARQTVRIPDDEWDEFGIACERNGAERSAYLLEVVRWALGRPGAEPPSPTPGALPLGVHAHIEARTTREPKGHTVYSVTALAPIDEVAKVVGSIAPRFTAEAGGRTRIETDTKTDRTPGAPTKLDIITEVRRLLLAAGIDLVIEPDGAN